MLYSDKMIIIIISSVDHIFHSKNKTAKTNPIIAFNPCQFQERFRVTSLYLEAINFRLLQRYNGTIILPLASFQKNVTSVS
jgi:hypothetical protein